MESPLFRRSAWNLGQAEVAKPLMLLVPTVRVALAEPPLAVPVMTTVPEEVWVVTVKVPLVAPAAMLILEGTVAREVLALDRVTV